MADKLASELIQDALQDAAILGEGKSPTPYQNDRALSLLNDLIAMWSADGLLVVSTTLVNFTLTAGTASYSIGSGQTFDTARPVAVRSAYVRDSAGTDYELKVLTADEEYNRIPDKSASARPCLLLYHDSYPYGSIKLWPAPDSAYTLYMDLDVPLTEVTDVSDSMALPGEYRMFVRTSLADALCAGYGKDTPRQVARNMLLSRAAIERRNLQVPESRPDPALTQRQGRGTYDINSG